MIKNTLLKRLIAWTLCLLLTPVWGAERTTYYHLDLLGSPVAATDSSGQVIWREEYKPYGEHTLGQDQSTGAPGYTGKVHEDALGLSYYGARWYDPELGRFTGVDPAGFKEADIHSFNRYAYANNNPYKYTDPDGRNPLIATEVLIIATLLILSVAILSNSEQMSESLRQGLKAFNESSEGDDNAPGDNARSTDDPVDLEEDLAGQEVLGDFENGGGENINKKMGDPRFFPNGTHDKLRGDHKHSDGTTTEVHADKNRQTGELSNKKFKTGTDNQKSR